MKLAQGMLAQRVVRASGTCHELLCVVQANCSGSRRMRMSDAAAALNPSRPSLLLLERIQSHSLAGVSVSDPVSGALPAQRRESRLRTVAGSAAQNALCSRNAHCSDGAVVCRRACTSHAATSRTLTYQLRPPGMYNAAAGICSTATATAADAVIVGRPSPFADAEARSVYLHSPWCKNKCHYCDFPVVAVGADGLGRAAVQNRMQVMPDACVSLCCRPAVRGSAHNQLLGLMWQLACLALQEYVDLLLAEIDAAPHVKRGDKVGRLPASDASF